MKRIKLLVSVRNVEEAVAVAKVGVDCIDLKEPMDGPLARLATDPANEIVRKLGSSDVPPQVSVAMGEWADGDHRLFLQGTGFEKWGTSRCGDTDWRSRFDAFAARAGAGSRIIPVCYADWETCEAPPPEEVLRVAIEPAVFLIDTFLKDGRSLVDLMGMKPLMKQRDRVKTLALAGSIKWNEIETLKTIEPDWIAVRGLVCSDGDRKKSIDPARVQRLKDMLN